MLKYYIAYGSNLNLEMMKKRCPNSKCVGKGYLKGYELAIRGPKNRCYLTINDKEDSRIPVGIFLVDQNDELALDEYEDYPELYDKKNVEVTYLDHESQGMKTVIGFVYQMVEGMPYGKASQEYIETCLKGYHDFGFDFEIIKKLT